MSLVESGLDTDTLEAIRGTLARFPAVERAILYGSRAMGTQRPASDIDLTLVGESLGNDELQEIDLALDDLLLPWTFDLSIHHRLVNEALRAHIDRVGVTLYERASVASSHSESA
ncbi:nucleotidyltransferase domain-containing protein [Halomonas sp. TRM85114]|uniref:nucleotidyltransferase domain-containing protein n=1 Tax=Halomonas jincaotanensis TaxID=2810616 RepID=UPI001BD65446|nr:nucleotidyltransferase domain-containing protein [Halomonas jincaotanensis]MBS9402419.1 nucleotidyltransferase domain-containing protein [Halomonas jincaotanensis]